MVDNKSVLTSWDLSHLFKGDNDPEMQKKRKEAEKAYSAFIKKWKSDDSYLSDPKSLKESLDEYEKLMCLYAGGGIEEYYFWLRQNQDENNHEIKAKNKKIEEFSNKLSNDINFFELRLSKIDSKKQKELLSSKLLEHYKHYLERLFLQGKHLLGENEEKIMSLKSGTSYQNWTKMLSGFISKEEREVLTKEGKSLKNVSEIMTLMTNKDKKIRDSAGRAFNDILAKHKDAAEAEINSVLENKKVNDELRGYSRADQSRHMADDIETDIVDALVDSVSKEFSIAKRYYSLKAKLLGLDKMEYHEKNVPYGEIVQEYEFDNAVKLSEGVFSKLDSRFSDIFNDFFKKGRIDVFPRKGKRSGAFCVWWSPTLPVYLMLNYTKTLRDVTTLAHEFGHAINAELSRKQNALTFNTPTSTSEVASTFMEDFVTQELLKKADDETRLALIVERLNDDVSTIFRQIACYKFEQELHKKFREQGYLSANEIGEIFQKHMKTYMGDSIIQSPGSENWWIYWSHIRTYFYVYSYASGLLISKALQSKVKKDPKFIEKVKEIFSAGSSKSPKELFRSVGIDMADKNFWEQGIGEIKNSLDEAEKLAKRLGKI